MEQCFILRDNRWLKRRWIKRPAADVRHELTDYFVSVMVLQRLPDGRDEVGLTNTLLYHYFEHLKQTLAEIWF